MCIHILIGTYTHTQIYIPFDNKSPQEICLDLFQNNVISLRSSHKTQKKSQKLNLSMRLWKKKKLKNPFFSWFKFSERKSNNSQPILSLETPSPKSCFSTHLLATFSWGLQGICNATSTQLPSNLGLDPKQSSLCPSLYGVLVFAPQGEWRLDT